MAAVGTNSAELRAIKKNRSKLVTAIAKQGGLTWFSQKLQEFDFITSELVSGITGKMGVSDEDKVSSLLEAVESKIKLNQRGTPFSDFVEILESEGCLQDMGQALRHMIKERASRSEDDIISGQIAMRMSEAKPSLSTQDSSADSTGGVTTLLQQLQAQIEQLRVTVRPDENVRSCPICNTELPAHLHQQDIESHVKAHFQDLAEISEQRPKLAEENTHKVQQKQLQHNSRSGTVEEALVEGSCESSGVQAAEERVKELEEQVEQMGQNYEAASRELSRRAEESKQQQAQVEELLTRLAQMQREFTELRDRKNEALALQQAVLDEKVSELVACQQQKLALEEQLPRLAEDNTKLEHKVEQLRAQISQLKAAARSDKNVRSCPICNTTFPALMHQQDIERHVKSHFQDQAEVSEQLPSVVAENIELQYKVQQLQAQIKQQMALGGPPPESDVNLLQCPVCNTKFPPHIQQQFQPHVQGHFLKETECFRCPPGLIEENTKLEHKMQQLQVETERLKAAASLRLTPLANVRNCPVCSTKFPGHMHQQDFERHVQGHFQERN